MDKVTQEGLHAVKANFKWIADELKVLAFTFRTLFGLRFWVKSYCIAPMFPIGMSARARISTLGHNVILRSV